MTLLFFIAIPLLPWLIAIETGEEFSEEKRKSRWFGESKLIGIEWMYCKARALLERGGRSADGQPALGGPTTLGVGTDSQGSSRPGSMRGYGTMSEADASRASPYHLGSSASNVASTDLQQLEQGESVTSQPDPRHAEPFSPNEP